MGHEIIEDMGLAAVAAVEAREGRGFNHPAVPYGESIRQRDFAALENAQRALELTRAQISPLVPDATMALVERFALESAKVESCKLSCRKWGA